MQAEDPCASGHDKIYPQAVIARQVGIRSWQVYLSARLVRVATLWTTAAQLIAATAVLHVGMLLGSAGMPCPRMRKRLR